MPDAKKGNGFDPVITTRFVSEIERHLDQIESYKGEHMQRCQSVRELISEVYDRAKDSGLPKQELKAVIRARTLEAKAKAARDDLEDMERRETFDQIRLALGDLSELPLGAAPLSDAPDAPKGDPNAEAAKRNTEALRTGIKPMKPKNGTAALDELSATT